MFQFARTTLLATAALLISVGPVLGLNNCAAFVSTFFNGRPSSGYLIGTKQVTLTGGWDFYFSGSGSESFCVGTYGMDGGEGYTYHIELRCDNYTIWGWF